MINIVPYPRKVTKTDRTIEVNKEISIDYKSFSDYSLQAFLERMNVKIVEGPPFIKLVRNEDLSNEEYDLSIHAEGLIIEAATEKGIIWALTTVAQLEDNGELPICRITDSPLMSHRSLLLDCSRTFFPPEQVKKIIEEISLAKMNTLHWGLTNDQGWRVESDKYPLLHETSSDYYTKNDIREIVSFAQKRGVEIIPEFNMPGHSTGILAAYPEYSCSGKKVNLASTGGIYPVILCAGSEKTYEFIENILDEWLEIFPSKKIHIGGDEAPKTEWEKCPCCKNKIKEEGLKNSEELQGNFLKRVTHYLENNNRQAICWNETLRGINDVPSNIQIQYWTLQDRKTMETYVKQNLDWIYSDMFELYLDYPYSMTSMKKIYHTDVHLGENSYIQSKSLKGMEACLWTEHVHDSKTLENRLFPRIYALAEITWSGRKEYEGFKSRLKKFINHKLHSTIAYTDENWWDPEGKARQEEAFEYFVGLTSGMSEEVREETLEASQPNEEFEKSFITKFFHESDIPFLLSQMDRK